MNKNLSKTFDFLRFPLAILVVFLHISPVISTFYPHPITYNAEGLYLLLNMAINKISNCAVPVYFFISGYLIVANLKYLNAAIYLKKLKSRFWTLFVPYIIWNILATAYLFVTEQIEGELTFYFLFIKPANFPLWFIRDLMLLVVTFPLFYYGFKILGHYLALLMLVLFVLYFGHSMGIRFTLIPIFFWGTGIYLGINKFNLDNVSKWVQLSAVLVTLALLFTILLCTGKTAMMLDNVFLVFGSFSIIAVAHYIVKHTSLKIAGVLSASSFFVFCFHKLGPTYVAKYFVKALGFDPAAEEFIIFLVCPFLSVLICFLTYRLGKKICPNLLNILTGGK